VVLLSKSQKKTLNTINGFLALGAIFVAPTSIRVCKNTTSRSNMNNIRMDIVRRRES
jgi:hypothetical protein